MTEERWTEQTEKLVRVASSDPGSVTPRGWYPAEADPDREPEALYRWQARAILLRLADAGLLVAPGGEVREDWEVESTAPSGATVHRPTTAMEDDQVGEFLAWARLDRPYETGHRIMRRTVVTGPWREVSP